MDAYMRMLGLASAGGLSADTTNAGDRHAPDKGSQ
jgi:hypothetical protein